MTGSSSITLQHRGTAKAPDECQKCTSAGGKRGVADETTQGQLHEMVRTLNPGQLLAL